MMLVVLEAPTVPKPHELATSSSKGSPNIKGDVSTGSLTSRKGLCGRDLDLQDYMTLQRVYGP